MQFRKMHSPDATSWGIKTPAWSVNKLPSKGFYPWKWIKSLIQAMLSENVQKDVAKGVNSKMLLPAKQARWVSVTNKQQTPFQPLLFRPSICFPSLRKEDDTGVLFPPHTSTPWFTQASRENIPKNEEGSTRGNNHSTHTSPGNFLSPQPTWPFSSLTLVAVYWAHS